MFPVKWNIDGKPFSSQWVAEPNDLLYAAALALVGTPDDLEYGPESKINLELGDFMAGAGTVAVRQALEWVMSPEGQKILATEEPFNFKPQLEAIARRML